MKMDTRIKKKELLELKTDIKLLLECLEIQKEDSTALKQALMTLASILQGSVEAKDVFSDTGGLQKVLKLVSSYSCDEVVEAGLYCLGSGVERNVYSQKLLTTASMFTLLHGILSSNSRSSVRKKQTASFLVLCLVSNNGFGQNLVRQSSCLHDILALIRTTMPNNIQDLDSDWFVGMEGKSLTLWCTLLSTACACVNNPLNEGNQRICASLLPYLFSMVTNQTDERVLRPVLSLIGLTVSGNVSTNDFTCIHFASPVALIQESNQDRVRKCGGLEIFVRKLGSLKQDAAIDSTTKAVTVQLLSTVDACLSDNECNSKHFGKLGGIKMVLSLLSDCCLDPSEKIQAVLTLAHALDSYIGNRKYIEEGGGITVLLQQLTVTQDEEFSKTIKYLLHMCVSTDKSSTAEDERDLTDTERLISKMETMKRYNDIEMLKKIKELDCKLKCMEEKNQLLESNHNGKTSPSISYHLSRSENDRADAHSMQTFDATGSMVGSQSAQLYQQECPTPREKSLMEQLIKERIEKERLEKLNYMLQENICQTRTVLTNARLANNEQAAQKSACTAACESVTGDTNNSNVASKQHKLSYVLGNNIENRIKLSGSQNLESVCKLTSTKGMCSNNEDLYQSALTRDSFKSNSEPLVLSAMVTRSGQRYQMHAAEAYNNQQSQALDLTNRPGNSAPATEGLESPFSNKHSRDFTVMDTSTPLHVTSTRILQPNGEEQKSGPFVAIPLDPTPSNRDMSNSSSGATPNISAARVKTTRNQSNHCSLEKRQVLENKSDAKPLNLKPKTTINKHAEIQCGTPFVTALDAKARKEKEEDGYVLHVHESSSQTELSRIPKQHDINNEKLSSRLKSKRVLMDHSESSNREKQEKQTTNVKSDNSNSKNDVNLKELEIGVIEPVDNKGQKVRQETSQSNDISITKGFFIKPVARPPKKKIRVTPLLGSDKISGLRSETDIRNDKDENGSDIQSEFDLNLFKKVKRAEKPAPILKSQNNTRDIDKMLGKQEGSRIEKWHVQPSTPVRQSIVPPRPAYSDCGTRRCVLSSPYSMKSQGVRRRSLDDSGIHSPQDILSISRHDNSPIDSNIDGFRSSSDISDEEEGHPNISAAVLRSSKNVNKKSENKCPGCTGVCSSSRDGLELNSRTYNIALETDPNTCLMHRKLRQLERIYIHKLRKSKGVNSRLKRKLKMQKVTVNDVKSKQAVYEFSTDSADNISPASDDNFENFQPPVRTKKRRKRVPYTEEEEEDLIEGVRVLGKHWNQILNTYRFHPSRTNVDLMDKYKRMMASNGQATSSRCWSVRSRTQKPFSMCEERRLRRGIMKHGYNWKTILTNFTFAQGRTTEDLRNKWRILHKKM